MKACILTIGDELLNGSTIDSNSAFIASHLVAIGVQVRLIFSVSDSFDGIYEGLDLVPMDCSLVLITGGLGPTNDDITKQVLSKYFNSELIFNEKVYQKIEQFFSKRGKNQVELNKKLAYIPENCELIPNKLGTAEGMLFNKDKRVYISMPGVPSEMKYMFTHYVLSILKNRFSLPNIIYKYILTAGIGESVIYEKIEHIEKKLPEYIKLAYLPSSALVSLRLSSYAAKNEKAIKVEKELEDIQSQITSLLKPYVYSLNPKENLASVVGNMLKSKQSSLTTAESCTGGYIAHLLTKNAGSSAYYEGSIIAYSYAIKERLLNVSSKTLNTMGAVSEETVIEMARGSLNQSKANYTIAVSGIAGPGGGTPQKPVGTVWIAVGTKANIEAKKFELSKHRLFNIKATSIIALNELRNFILKEEE